jgi:acetyl esterase
VQDSGLKERMEFLANCTPGYYNGEGGENAKGSVWEFEYSTGAADFFDILRDWRSVSHLPGLEVDGCALEKSSSDKKYLRSEEAIRVQLHREMKAYLHQLRFANAPAIGSIDTEQFRKMVEVGATMNGRGPELYRVEDHSLDSHGYNLPVRVYRGNENTDSIIMYFHGGGWCIGSIESYDGVVRRLAKTTGATIVSVDYRLAPEMPFPAAVDDASTALMWANNNRKMLAKKDAPLFVCGDSAGANLAAVLSLLGRDSLDIDIAGQVLIYPSVAGEVEHPDFDAFEAPFLNKEDIKWFFDQYVPRLEDRSDIRFAPINAESHAGLPPAFVMTAEFDLLKGQGEAYAEKLKQDGTDVHLKNYPGALHGFFSYGVGLIQSEEAIVDITSFINSLKH